MEIVISRKLLESLKLEDLNDILSGLMEKLSSGKPVFLLADPANPNKLLSTSKAEYDKFIKEAVVDKQKLGEVTARDRMVDLIQRISNYYEQTKQEKLTNLEKQQVVLNKRVQELLAEKESDHSREPTNTSVSGTNQIMIKSDWVRDIPVFRASENDILDEWIYVVEKLATKNKVSYDALVEEVTPYLKDRALRCYRIWEKESYDKSWESLKGKFNSLYNSRDSQNKL